MEEVIFRSSRKLENLQVQLDVASEQGRAVVKQLSNQTKSSLLRMLNSSSSIHIQETVKQLTVYVLEVINKIKLGFTTHIRSFYGNIYGIIGLRWTRQNVYSACVGFFLGGLVGFGIAAVIYKRHTVIRYMQAIQCMNYTGIQAVTVVEDAIAPYECELNEVLVDVKAASVQIIDAQICSGYGHKIRKLMSKYNRFSKYDLPVTLGRDCTGVIMDIGKNVNRLEIGDEVWLTVPFWSQGTLSQTVLVHENKIARKPKSIGYEASCSLPYAGTMALSALNQSNLTANNCEDKRILIQEGCTPVGCILIQILHSWNAHITTTCFKRAVPVAHALGAQDVICLSEEEQNDKTENDKNDTDLIKLLTKELQTRSKFDVIIVTGCHGLTLEELHHYRHVHGQVISSLPTVLYSDSFGFVLSNLFSIFIRTKFFIWRLFGSEINYFDETHMCFVLLDKLQDLVENGHLQTVVDKVYHPSDIELALNHIQSSQSIGSTIISFR